MTNALPHLYDLLRTIINRLGLCNHTWDEKTWNDGNWDNVRLHVSGDRLRVYRLQAQHCSKCGTTENTWRSYGHVPIDATDRADGDFMGWEADHMNGDREMW